MARMNTDRRSQNRSQRPASREAKKEYKEVFGVTQRGEQSFWTRIGAAFVNGDAMRSPALCGVARSLGSDSAVAGDA